MQSECIFLVFDTVKGGKLMVRLDRLVCAVEVLDDDGDFKYTHVSYEIESRLATSAVQQTIMKIGLATADYLKMRVFA